MVKLRLSDLVSISKNSRNLQERLNLKKNKLKEFNLTVNDLLDLKVHKKLKKFDEA